MVKTRSISPIFTRSAVSLQRTTKKMREIQSQLPPEYEDHGWIWLFLRKPAATGNRKIVTGIVHEPSWLRLIEHTLIGLHDPASCGWSLSACSPALSISSVEFQRSNFQSSRMMHTFPLCPPAANS